MNIFIKILFVLYIVVGVLFLSAPSDWFFGFYHTPSMGILALASAVLIWLPRLILRKHKESSHFVRFNLLITLGILINGLGGLGLYRLYLVGFEYDKLTHFVTPLLLTFAFFILFKYLWMWDFKKSLWVSAVFILFLGFLWEGFEQIANLMLDESVFVLGGGGSILRDTVLDVVFNTLGIITASFYILRKNKATGRIGQRQ